MTPLRRVTLLAAFPAFLGGVACGGTGESTRETEDAGAGGAGADAAVNSEGRGDPAGLVAADRAFAAAVARDGLEAWVEAFAEDGVMVVPGGVLEGRGEIRAAMAPSFSDSTFSISWEPERAETGPSGETGFTVGRYVRRRTAPDGEVVESRGRYVTVWRRSASGEWVVALDAGIPDPG